MYAGIQQDVEDRMISKIAGVGLDEREALIIKACSVIAAQIVSEETQKLKREFRRDLESVRESVDLAQAIGRSVTRALRY